MDEMRLRVREIAARCEEMVSSTRRQIKLSTEWLDAYDRHEREHVERRSAQVRRLQLRDSMIKSRRARQES
jgi:hypothetical protein